MKEMNRKNKKICQAKTNHNRAGMAKWMSDKTDFNVIGQENHYKMLRGIR